MTKFVRIELVLSEFLELGVLVLGTLSLVLMLVLVPPWHRRRRERIRILGCNRGDFVPRLFSEVDGAPQDEVGAMG